MATPIDAGLVLVVHPIFVHFAIALTIVAVLLDAVGRWQGSETWQQAGQLNLSLGVGGVALAVVSGWFENQLPRAQGPFEAQARKWLEYHEYLGFGLLGLFICLLIWRWRIQGQVPVSFLVLALLGVIGMAAQGYLGGEMVYRYGVRVRAVEVLGAGWERSAISFPEVWQVPPALPHNE
jgi:uncharacterized membrane protein